MKSKEKESGTAFAVKRKIAPSDASSFYKGGLAVENREVLAMYKRNEDVDIGQARRMISGLMRLFGEPTTMAHDKLI